MSDYYVGKTQCIGSLQTACSFIVNSEHMEEEFLDNHDDDGNKFPTWEAVVKYLVDECDSGEVYELSTVRE